MAPPWSSRPWRHRGARVHGAAVRHAPATATPLRLVHGDAGPPDQLLLVGPARRARRDPHAGAHLGVAAGHRERPGDLGEAAVDAGRRSSGRHRPDPQAGIRTIDDDAGPLHPRKVGHTDLRAVLLHDRLRLAQVRRRQPRPSSTVLPGREVQVDRVQCRRLDPDQYRAVAGSPTISVMTAALMLCHPLRGQTPARSGCPDPRRGTPHREEGRGAPRPPPGRWCAGSARCRSRRAGNPG